jgi:hypothetical protein
MLVLPQIDYVGGPPFVVGRRLCLVKWGLGTAPMLSRGMAP